MLRNPAHVGAELRRLRREAGLPMARVAERAGWAEGTQSRLETGVTPIKPGQVAVLADILRLSPVTRMRLDRALGVERPADPWWVKYGEVLSRNYEELILIEAQATSMDVASTIIPGPMQAQGYARATLLQSPFVPDPDDAEMLLEVRLQRAEIITERGVPVSATLPEAVLSAGFCGRIALQEQLQYLLDLSRLENVCLRILPSDAEVHPFLGAVTVLDLPALDAPVAYAEWESGSAMIRDVRTVRRHRRNLDYQRAAALSEDQSQRLMQSRLEAL
ncbi:helix-turn-helix domain-containing protein [Embleya scabrispora]|uniref:helix-turn-helix domain-containing protein n=1 Tax=Embleya scabrispora TaxID=159449 RepID=UPI00099EDDF1|nr:helix-turn-helix transcriptional regulator [Embleya scabrispora]MYS83453.1 helix-turn-helix domain-containing protein [Streptomyces sp. SID5474]